MSWTRREFLVASAGLAAAAACAGGDNSAQKRADNAAPDPSTFGQFDHLVVLMMENRSLDNMLGYLYEPDAVPRGQTFDGVAGKNLSNPGPDGAVPVKPGTV